MRTKEEIKAKARWLLDEVSSHDEMCGPNWDNCKNNCIKKVEEALKWVLNEQEDDEK